MPDKFINAAEAYHNTTRNLTLSKAGESTVNARANFDEAFNNALAAYNSQSIASTEKVNSLNFDNPVLRGIETLSNVLNNSEKVAAKSLNNQTDLVTLTTSIEQAARTLETITAVKNKAVQSFLSIFNSNV
jgi:flagellar hook-basal body complex protein FliE